MKLDPAKTVFEMFRERMPDGRERSGCAVISQSLGLSYSSVYRWQIPTEIDRRGLNGRIPGRHFPALRSLAKQKRINLPWRLLTGQGAHNG